MNVSNTNVYNLKEALVASGFPFRCNFCAEVFDSQVKDFDNPELNVGKLALDRAHRLVNAGDDSSGHKNFLTGILVSFNVTATNTWWMQFERYHFIQIVSSQSKMHCLEQLMGSNVATEHVSDADWSNLNDALCEYQNGRITYDEFVACCPMGLQLTAHVVTNYMQLRTIYKQRKNHKLQEWHRFCGWIETLPYAKELIIND